MAAISVIKKFEIEGAKRIDAEYYQPMYLNLVVKLHRNSCLQLRKLNVSLDCSAFYPSVASFYKQTGIPFLRIDDIQDGFIILTDTTAYLHEAVLEQNPNTIARCYPGDIVIAKGGNTIAKVGILTDEHPEYASCRDLIVVRTESLSINRYYLLAYLLSSFGQSLMIRTASQTGQPHLTLTSIKELSIPTLSESLQLLFEKNLVNAWNFFHSAKLVYNHAEQLLLSELGLQDWQSACTLTYVRRYSEVARMQRTDAEHFQPKYVELRNQIRNYPNGFCKLTDIAINSDEIIEPHNEPDREFEYIELANINQTIGSIEDANHIKGKDAPSRARMLLRSGDVIVSTVEGSLDKVALVPDEYNGAVGSTGFFVLRPRTVESGYLLALTKSLVVREQMRCESSGTILAAVPAKSLKNIIVPNVPPEKRSEIDTLVQQSHTARREAKTLLEKAKRAVEIAIEEDEEKAMEFLMAKNDMT
ncbi:Uncharacterised protein [uncultured archaeon]|nr:Uncharacterised protein [uncultured archaeon]